MYSCKHFINNHGLWIPAHFINNHGLWKPFKVGADMILTGRPLHRRTVDGKKDHL